MLAFTSLERSSKTNKRDSVARKQHWWNNEGLKTIETVFIYLIINYKTNTKRKKNNNGNIPRRKLINNDNIM